MKKRLVLPVLVMLAALALAACGGGESDEDKIVGVIETAATNTDPANCSKISTTAFLEQSEAEEGAAAALKACEEDAKDTSDNPEKVTVTDVETDGSSATASVAFVGGGFDGQTLSLGLVEEEGEWKLDEIAKFVTFNKDNLVTALEEQLNSPETELEPGQTACIVEGLEETSDAELEQVILEGSDQLFVELAEACAESQ